MNYFIDPCQITYLFCFLQILILTLKVMVKFTKLKEMLNILFVMMVIIPANAVL